MSHHFKTLLKRLLPATRLRASDDTSILSMQDIHRHRLILISAFGLVVSLAFTAFQVLAFEFSGTAFENMVTGAIGGFICIFGITTGLWRDQIQRTCRILVLIFSAVIWYEIAISGGVTGYHALILPVLPVIAAMLLQSKDTILFTVLNLLVIAIIAGLRYGTNVLPPFEVAPETGVALTITMLIIAVVGCATGAFTMAHQNEKIGTQLRELLNHHAHMSIHDPLSGLGNRIRMQQRFDETNADDRFDILLIDLDGFKAINDTYGHNAGDYLITALSERLREAAQNDDLLIRLGGDEFVILIEDMDCPSFQVRRYADYLIEILSRPYPWEGQVLRISASIGHARFPVHADTPSKTLSLADKALYVAKRAGKRQCVTHGTPPDAQTPDKKMSSVA